MDDIQPKEFIAEENLYYKEKEMSEDEGVSEDDETIKTLYVHSPATAEEPPSEAICSGPLTLIQGLLRKRMSIQRSLHPTIKLN
jgi:hypothetical protein